MKEADFQRTVIEAARVLGWLVVHFRPAKTEKGWRTAISGDPGFVDLVFAKRGRVIHAELKSEGGRLSPDQATWGLALGSTYRCWRPSDWPEIEKELKR